MINSRSFPLRQSKIKSYALELQASLSTKKIYISVLPSKENNIYLVSRHEKFHCQSNGFCWASLCPHSLVIKFYIVFKLNIFFMQNLKLHVKSMISFSCIYGDICKAIPLTFFLLVFLYFSPLFILESENHLCDLSNSKLYN